MRTTPNLFVDMESRSREILPDGWRRVLETVRAARDSTEADHAAEVLPLPGSQSASSAKLDYDLDMSASAPATGRCGRSRLHQHEVNGSGDPAAEWCSGGDPESCSHSRNFAVRPGAVGVHRRVRHRLGGLPARRGRRSAQEPDTVRIPQRPKARPTQADDTTAAPGSVTASTSRPQLSTRGPRLSQDLTNGYFEVAQKWLSGSLTLTDVADYRTRVGGSLASAPWKYLQAMTTPRTARPARRWQMTTAARTPAAAPGRLRPWRISTRSTGSLKMRPAQDDAGKWGIDGWVRLIHNLLDLQVRTYAGAVQSRACRPVVVAATCLDEADTARSHRRA